ncbi:MAG: DoxX family protein [Verrucomicrobiales bacterium]
MDLTEGFFKDLALALARLLGGGAVIHFHAWGEVMAGFNHFFGPKRPWVLASIIESAGLPHGVIIASVCSLLAFAAGWALLVGLLSRLAACLLLVITGLVFAFAQTDLLRELAVAYAGGFLVVLFAGPGRLAVDSLFSGRSEVRPHEQKGARASRPWH